MYRIQVEEDGMRTTQPLRGASLRIGRDVSNDLVLRDRFVSAHHGELRRGADGLWFEDFATTNGSRLLRDGTSLPVDSACGHRVRLRDGDELLIGDKRRPVRLFIEEAPSLVSVPAAEADDQRTQEAPSGLEATSAASLDSVAASLGRESLLALHRLGLRLAGPLGREDVLRVLGEGMLEALPGASRVEVWVEDSRGRLAAAVSRNRTTRVPARSLSTDLRRRVLAQGLAVTFAEPAGDDGSEARAGACLPLWDGRDVIGLVVADGPLRAGAAPSPEELALATLLAHQGALALAAALRLQRSQQLASSLG